MEFACLLDEAAKKSIVGVLETIQKKIVRNVKGVQSRAHTNDVFLELGILKFKDLVEYNSRIIGHGVWLKTLPGNIRSDFEYVTKIGRETRAMGGMNLKIPFCGKKWLETAPCLTIPIAWNGLEMELKSEIKPHIFKKRLKIKYFDKYRNEPKCKRKGCYSCTRFQ